MGILDTVLGVGSALYPVAGGIAEGYNRVRELEQKQRENDLERRYRESMIAENMAQANALANRNQNRRASFDLLKQKFPERFQGVQFDPDVNWGEELIRATRPATLPDIMEMNDEQFGKYSQRYQQLHPQLPPVIGMGARDMGTYRERVAEREALVRDAGPTAAQLATQEDRRQQLAAETAANTRIVKNGGSARAALEQFNQEHPEGREESPQVQRERAHLTDKATRPLTKDEARAQMLQQVWGGGGTPAAPPAPARTPPPPPPPAKKSGPLSTAEKAKILLWKKNDPNISSDEIKRRLGR